MWEFLDKHKIIFGIAFVVIGLFECFFGRKLMKPTLFVLGYITGFGLLLAIFGEFVIGPEENYLLVWMILVIAILFGCLLGYLTASLERVGFFFAGMWLGIIIAFLLNSAFLHKAVVGGSNIILWIAILCFG